MFLFRRFSKSFVLILIFILFLLILFYSKRNNQQYSNAEYRRMKNRTNLIGIKNYQLDFYVHFDLKGAPPKLIYFEQLFPLLYKWGVTGICIEYEDMFPFDGLIQSIQHKQAYSKNDIQKINQLAKDNHLDIMPLLQTYGHLEFLLKLNEFSHLRENLKYPQVITPCINETYTIIFTMIDQYLELHPNIRYFHIGHDEVYYFFNNPSCNEFKQLTGIKTHLELFAYHLNQISNYIKRKSPDLILFIWHDVIQNLDLFLLKKYNLMNLINPILWSYREDMSVEGFVTSSQANIFGKYQYLWGATAFKGATHEIAITSDVKHYYENQISWIKQLHSYIPTKWKNFNGIILTGWSRYDHFLSLCELLPYSIPSMLYSIAPWQQQFHSLPKIDVYPSKLHKYIQNELKCSSLIHLTSLEHLIKPIPNCQFPGANIYTSLISLSRIWQQMKDVELFVEKFITDYHIKYNYIHIKRAEECLEKLTPIMKLLNEFLMKFNQSMNEIYSEQVTIEWLETYFLKHYQRFKYRYDFIQHAINEQNKSWLPRPIPNINQLKLNR